MTEGSRARDAARVLFEFLYLRDPEIVAADAVIGFGHFDLKIPRRCLELHKSGLAPLIVFSGGMGAGTADLGRAEARAFVDDTTRCAARVRADGHPGIGDRER